MLELREYFQMFTTLFIMVDPIAAAPLFLSLLSHEPPAVQNRAARRAATTMTLLLLGTLAIGGWVLHFFGIRVASFRMIGGILFLLMSLDMLRAKPRGARITHEEETEAGQKEDVAIVPLGIPMLAGPGAISTMILFANHPFHWAHIGILVAMIGGLGLITWAMLRLSQPIGKLLGQTGINVLNRLMGILIGAIAIEYLMAGLRELLPALGKV